MRDPLLSRCIDWEAGRILRMEKSLVKDGAGAERELFWRFLVRWLFGVSVLLAALWWPHLWWLLIFLSMYITAGSMALIRSARSYRSGWLDGRAQLARNLQSGDGAEAIEREFLYDAVHVRGMGVETPDSPEGL